MKKMLAILIGSCLSMSVFAQSIQSGSGGIPYPAGKVTVNLAYPMPDNNYAVSVNNSVVGGGWPGGQNGKSFDIGDKTPTSFSVGGVTNSNFDWIAVHN